MEWLLLFTRTMPDSREHRLERRVVAVRLRLGFVPAGSHAALDRHGKPVLIVVYRARACIGRSLAFRIRGSNSSC